MQRQRNGKPLPRTIHKINRLYELIQDCASQRMPVSIRDLAEWTGLAYASCWVLVDSMQRAGWIVLVNKRAGHGNCQGYNKMTIECRRPTEYSQHWKTYPPISRKKQEGSNETIH